MIAFFLGSHPAVSKAELRQLLGLKEVNTSLSVAVFDCTEAAALSAFRLAGGSPRFGSVVATFDLKDTQDKLVLALKESLEKEKRREYVLSLYGYRLDKREVNRALKDLLTGVKYDGNFGEAQHAPAAVSHVIARGGHEYSVVSAKDAVYLIKTLQVQDPRYWTMVDADRPGRNMKIGMLPAKLARIMVNLSAVGLNDQIWDPFVGQGTIGMQSASIGIRFFGTDKAPQSISHARENLMWMVQKGLFKPEMVTLREMPVEKAKSPGFISALVTEPFLGKPHFKPFASEYLAKKEWADIERLFRAFFHLSDRVLEVGQRVVIVKPMFAFIAEREVQWYNPPLPTPAGTWKVPEILKDLGPLEWKQRDSVVGREIVVLEKS